MSVTGNELIARIESLVNLQTRSEIRASDQALANAMREDLAKHGAEQHAEEIFELLRRARREWSTARFAQQKKAGVENTIASMPRFEEFLLETLAPIGTFNLEAVFALYSKHGDLFEALLRQMNHARSKATHVLAVLRPLKERYVSAWEREVDFFAGDAIRKRAQELKSRIIGSQSNLEDWMNDVFELFSMAAVHRGEVKAHPQVQTGSKATRDRLVPAGLISEASERIYRQRWVNWFDDNREQLTRFIGEPGKNDGAPIAGFARVQADEKLSSHVFETFEVTSNVAANQPKVTKGVTVEIESSQDSSVSAQRTWVSQDLAVNELMPWLNVLTLAWGKASDVVSAKLRFQSDSGESEIVLPSMSLSEAKTRIADLVSSYR